MKIGNLKLKIPTLVGLATFFFGFFAGAVLNAYLLYIDSPFIKEFRSSLNYISAIVGDGVVLPIVNMIVASFLLKNKKLVSKFIIHASLFMGLLITTYFHITQAVNELVNWAMPKPWEWNFLGVWHGLYMYAVCSLLSLFLLVVITFVIKNKYIPKEALYVLVGVGIFLILLRLDYSFVSISSFF